MAEKPDSIILEYLRRFDGRQVRFEDAFRDMSARLASIESYLATMHRGGIGKIKASDPTWQGPI
jgi:hypothetical protein